jgi:hypothetical protein
MLKESQIVRLSAKAGSAHVILITEKIKKDSISLSTFTKKILFTFLS